MAVRGLDSPVAVVLAIGGLYVGQSVISGVTFSALPSVMRDQGLSLDMIGLTYLAVLPWVLKFLWAPAVERYRLPRAGESRSRSIVLIGGLVCAAGLLLGGLVGPANLAAIMAVILVVAFAASTVDIACDGQAVESLSVKHHGWGNAAQVGGAYLGSAIGAGLFLVLVAHLGWTHAMALMAALLVLLGLPFVLSPTPPAPARRLHRPSLRSALARPELRGGLALSALYAATQKWGMTMLGPFLVDAGLDLASLGIVNGAGGMAVGFACALLGGACVRRWGSCPVMILALAAQALALAALAASAWTKATPQEFLVALALVSSSGIMALGFVALYAQFMALSDPRQAGIDFTLLQSMDALVSMMGGLGAGWISQHYGYGACFGLSAALAFIAVPITARLSARPKPLSSHEEQGAVSELAPFKS